MNYLTNALREHQELAVFLTLAIGFFIGRLKIGTFSLGTAVGTLLAGVAIGQLNIQVPAVVKYVFFDLFLFTTGYKVGPQFFRALKEGCVAAACHHARPLRHVPDRRVYRCETARLRRGYGSWYACRRIHRIHRHRNRQRRYQSRGHHTGRGQNQPDQ